MKNYTMVRVYKDTMRKLKILAARKELTVIKLIDWMVDEATARFDEKNE